MTTIAYVFILAAIIIARQTAKGRALNLPEDLSDAFLALVKGDQKELGTVFSRTGDSTTPTAVDTSVANLTGGVTGALTTAGVAVAGGIGEASQQLKDKLGNSIGLAAILLGTKAKGYRFGATGPDYYDCSGLMWRAAQTVGYKGRRFTTFDIGSIKQFKKISPPNAQGPGLIRAGINDIVVWPTHHMGVVTGPNRFYSARSRKSGISETSISGFRNSTPVYYRYIP
jgi:cell wall-associated NlpC family hydrolase